MTDMIKIDSELKESAALLFGSIGLDLAEAIEMFFKKALAVGELPFEPIEREQAHTGELEMLVREMIASGKVEAVDYDANEKGQVIIDKDKDPDMYDWAVNG